MPNTRYLCPECGKDFVKKCTLDRHINTIHLKDTFTCQQCGKSFNRGDNLARHKCKESESIQCERCGKGFGKKYHLNRHMKTHVYKS